MTKKNKQSGFTLVEMVIVIVIIGIIGGLASRIIGRSLEAYSALDRREKLQTSIRLAIERISRELRNSLPNSLCAYDDTNAVCSSDPQSKLYFLPIKSSGRYQDNTGNYGGGIAREPLQVGSASSYSFDVLSADINYPLNASTNDWISVYNINNSDIYSGTNDVRHQVETVTQKDILGTPGDITDDIDQVTLAPIAPLPTEPFFANHSPTRRFHVITDDAVTLFYFDENTKKLYRDTTTFAAPHTPSGSPRLLLENVTACTFTYVTGSQQRAGLLRIDITVEAQGEQIQVIQEDHEYNIP